MSEFFIGQIMMTGFSFAPKYFAACNGTTNFALLDLRGRTPIGFVSSVDPAWQPPGMQIGQAAGAENVTLLSSNLPTHTHAVNASTSQGDNRIPSTRVYATNTPATQNLYAAGPGTLST